MQTRIRRLRADEWEKLRDIRLEMIEDTPTAYLESPGLSTVMMVVGRWPA